MEQLSFVDDLIESGSDATESDRRLGFTRARLIPMLMASVVVTGACAAWIRSSSRVDAGPQGGNFGGDLGLWWDWNYKWDGVWRDDHPKDLWHREDVMFKVARCKTPIRGDPAPCMSKSCLQDGQYVLIGCIDGYCLHGIPDKKCQGIGPSQRYWPDDPTNEWCSDGRRDRKCPALGLDTPGVEADHRWGVEEVVNRNRRIQANVANAPESNSMSTDRRRNVPLSTLDRRRDAPKSNSTRSTGDRRHLIRVVGEGVKPMHPKYVEGRIIHAEYYHHTWIDVFHSEAEAQAACDKKDDCKGYWLRHSGEYYLLHAGSRTFFVHHPDKTVVSVKGWTSATGASGASAPSPSPASDKCASSEDCQTSGCNLYGYHNHGCFKGKCYHGTPDASCHGLGNGQRYDGQPPDTWCWDGRRDSCCPSKAR